jgi:hypothetical protein
MTLDAHLRLVGLLMLLLATLHFVFPRRFRWREEFARVSLLNRQIFYVHCFFLALTLVLTGALCLLAPEALTEPTRLGKLLLGGLVLFWGLRLAFQWFVYDRRLWIGHSFNTCVHIVFTGLWLYFTSVFGWAWYLQWQISALR